MKRTRGARGAANIGCIIWLVIVALIGYALYKIVPVKVANSNFYDFMQEECGFGSIKGVGQLEHEILAKAKELGIPVGKEELTIRKTRESITIEAHYQIVVDFFNGVYRYVWKFDPVVSRPLFAV
jgi:hypothetical protein